MPCAERRILFLDDRDIRVAGFHQSRIAGKATIVRNALDAIRKLSVGKWDLVYLDHDLNDQRHGDPVPDRVNNGLAVALFIAGAQPTIREVIVHSTNDSAAREMVDLLDAAGYRVRHRKADANDSVVDPDPVSVDGAVT